MCIIVNFYLGFLNRIVLDFLSHRHIINIFIMTYQVGSCCVYVVFIAENLKALVDYAFNTKIEIRLIMLVLLLPLVLINWVNICGFKLYATHHYDLANYSRVFISMCCCKTKTTHISQIRNLKYLAPLSTIGNVVTLLSFAIICYYIFRDPITLEGKDPYRPIQEYPMFFGTVLFALEAIGVVRA